VGGNRLPCWSYACPEHSPNDAKHQLRSAETEMLLDGVAVDEIDAMVAEMRQSVKTWR
jgi:hypothetical protein